MRFWRKWTKSVHNDDYTKSDTITTRWMYLSRLIHLLWNLNRRGMLMIIFMAVADGLMRIATLVILQRFVDSVVQLASGAAAPTIVYQWLALLIAATIFQTWLELANWRTGTDIRERMRAQAQELLIQKASRLPLIAFQRPELYDQLDRAQEGLNNQLLETLAKILFIPSYLLTAIGLLLYLGSVHIFFPVIVLVGLIPTFLVSSWELKQRYLLDRMHTAPKRELSYLDNLMIDRQAAAEIRLFDLQEYLIHKRQELFRRLRDDRLRLARVELQAYTLPALTGLMTFGLVTIGVVVLIAQRRLSIGYFTSYLVAADRFHTAATTLLWNIAAINNDLRYIRDLIDYLAIDEEDAAVPAMGASEPARPLAPPDTPATPAIGLNHTPSVIQFESVSFTYPGADQPVLKDITLVLRPGERIALVGANGAGKSTLTKLLLGMYRPSGGRITVDGVDLETIDPQLWRSRIAAVFQDYMKYELTIRDNIGFGDLRYLHDLPAIHQAATKSQANTIADTFTTGYETTLGKAYDDDGRDLSIGQWQKLAIARAYLRDALVLVLDEPTAALDARAEVDIYRQFRDVAVGKSVLLISHRLGSARLADRIVFLENGHIIEQGTHADLMTQAGHYAQLYSIQAEWYR